MKRVIALLALPVLFLLASPVVDASPPPQANAKQTVYGVIRCKSPGGRYSTCPADTRRGVSVSRDFSGRCRLGRTWGYTRNEIWVNDGCDAEFQIGNIGRPGGDYGYRNDYGDDLGYGYGWGHDDGRIIVCASEDYRRQFCPAPTSMGVRLINQISRSECVRGRTWWRDERGIVVTQGCAGEFQIGYRDDAYQWPPSQGAGGPVRPNEFRCESIDDRKRYCPADIGRGRAALLEQHSRSSCMFGRTWGFDSRGVWVDRGCRATFRIDYIGAGNSWYPGQGQNYMRCESRDYRQAQCRVGYNVRSVRLVRQVSDSACIEGRSWGFNRGVIWVDNGCAADFELR
ncbi:MAG: DUF3011 domain-containing protein [Lysobacteraceae bacterium]